MELERDLTFRLDAGRGTLPVMSASLTLLERALSSTATPYGSSRWSEYARCPRAYQLRYSHGIMPVEDAGYFEVGRVIHGAIAYAALGAMFGTPCDWRDAVAAARKRGADGWAALEATRLLAGYFEQWGTENAGYCQLQIADVESYYEAQLGARMYSSRLDALVHPVGSPESLTIVDHKSKAGMPACLKDEKDQPPSPRVLLVNADSDPELIELGRDYLTRGQFLGSAWLVRERHNLLPMIMINLIVKTKQPGYRRILVQPTHEQIDRWADNQRKRAALQTNEDWCNYDACAPAIGTRCWAFDFCHGDDKTRLELYKQVKQ